MAQIIKFPRRDDELGDISLSRIASIPVLERKIKDACFAMMEAMVHGSIKPDKFFMMYQEGDTCAYLNLNYGPDGLTKSVDLVLQDGLRDDS
jgi:hypothetical protein